MSLVTRITRCRSIAVATAALAGAIGIAGSAHATVNTTPPNAPYTYQWFPGYDCTVLVGAVRTGNGAAKGGADIACNHYHKIITSKVTLYRFTRSTGGQSVTSSAWTSVYDNYRLSVQTGSICGGSARWLTRTTVHVDGVQVTIDSPSQIYDPPC